MNDSFIFIIYKILYESCNIYDSFYIFIIFNINSSNNYSRDLLKLNFLPNRKFLFFLFFLYLFFEQIATFSSTYIMVAESYVQFCFKSVIRAS